MYEVKTVPKRQVLMFIENTSNRFSKTGYPFLNEHIKNGVKSNKIPNYEKPFLNPKTQPLVRFCAVIYHNEKRTNRSLTKIGKQSIKMD